MTHAQIFEYPCAGKAATSAWGRGMKVACYMHPGIFPQGPCLNDVWIEILGRLLQGLHCDAGSECLLISGSRFLRRAPEPRWRGTSSGVVSARRGGVSRKRGFRSGRRDLIRHADRFSRAILARNATAS
jgi:hypothetical protein